MGPPKPPGPPQGREVISQTIFFSRRNPTAFGRQPAQAHADPQDCESGDYASATSTKTCVPASAAAGTPCHNKQSFCKSTVCQSQPRTRTSHKPAVRQYDRPCHRPNLLSEPEATGAPILSLSRTWDNAPLSDSNVGTTYDNFGKAVCCPKPGRTNVVEAHCFMHCRVEFFQAWQNAMTKCVAAQHQCLFRQHKH